MTPTDYKSELDKYIHLVLPYCFGCGLDIGTQGASSIPWVWQLDLPEAEYNKYCGGAPKKGPIQLRGYADRLPVSSESLDFVISSHLLEDFADWMPILKEWVRVLKKDGRLIVLIPDKKLWAIKIAQGQPNNIAHRHEGQEGELSSYAPHLGLEVIMDRLTQCFPGDYTIVFIAVKK